MGKTTTQIITFKTDRLKSTGIFTVVITEGGFVILYHCLFKIIQGVHVQVQIISNNVPDAYASDDIELLISCCLTFRLYKFNDTTG